jgi:hypothetical protein
MILRAPALPRVSIRYCLLIFVSTLSAITYNEMKFVYANSNEPAIFALNHSVWRLDE